MRPASKLVVLAATGTGLLAALGSGVPTTPASGQGKGDPKSFCQTLWAGCAKRCTERSKDPPSCIAANCDGKLAACRRPPHCWDKTSEFGGGQICYKGPK
jgi:hypothetical protein